MIKNRVVQIIYQTIYLTLAFIGIIGSLGYFNGKFNTDFYAYYTNLSNYICIGVVIAAFVGTIKKAKDKEDGYVETAPKFNFLCVILILVTFLVYNILLAKDSSASEYFLSLSNLLMHLILPVMFVMHWVLFYQHGMVKWYYPLLCTVMPLIYVVFILIRAAILKGKEGVMLYPYFFLNVDKLGWGGFFMWISILVAIFVIIGYIFYFFDNFTFFKTKFKEFKEKHQKTNQKED